MADPTPKRRSFAAFLTGATEEEPPPEPRPPSSASEAPLYPPARRRRPATRVARPVSAAPPTAPPPMMIDPDFGDSVPVALPDHLAPPGAVIVAGVDANGVEYVLQDDPEALPLVDPRYDREDRNWVRYRTSWGGFLRIAGAVILVLWIITSVRGRIYGWVDDQIVPSGDEGALLDFKIPEGASTNNVATELANAGIINNATVFRYWLRCDGQLSITGFLSCDGEKSFQAGDYELNENMAYEDAVGVLDEGPIPVIFKTFTIPEGLRLPEIVDRLVAVNDRFDRDQLLEAMRNPSLVSDYIDPDVPDLLRLAGTLFPATYDIAEDDLGDEARFLRRMADTFDQRFGSLIDVVGRDPVITELRLTDYQLIVVASLIEEEAKVDVDRALMARAIYNRLLADMELEIDASVYYSVGKSFTETLLQSDLDNASPWNTYVSKGLPPTPIAAPGEAALRAALEPAEGEFIFWARTDANGVIGAHTFSVTNDEHNAAVAVCRDLGYCG